MPKLAETIPIPAQPRKEEIQILGMGEEDDIETINKELQETYPYLSRGVISFITEGLSEYQGRRVKQQSGQRAMTLLNATSLCTDVEERITGNMRENIFPPELFGFYGEKMVRDFLQECEGIEIVERATEKEDYQQKSDMFLKFKNIEIPLAIQFTFQTLQKKTGLCSEINKKQNNKSAINPFDNIKCPLILVNGHYHIFQKACYKWFDDSQKNPDATAIDYLPDEEKLYILMQLLRTKNKEQKNIIETIINPLLKRYYQKILHRQPMSDKLLNLSKYNVDQLEKLIHNLSNVAKESRI